MAGIGMDDSETTGSMVTGIINNLDYNDDSYFGGLENRLARCWLVLVVGTCNMPFVPAVWYDLPV